MRIRARSVLACACLLAAGALGCAGAPAPPQGAPAPPGRSAKIGLSRADGYFFNGRYREALADYAEVIAADPANAVAFRGRAAANAALGLESAALADYERAVTLDPRYDDAWFGRGLYLFSRGRYAEALDDFDRVAALDPRNALIQRYRALVCERVGRLRDARLARESYVHCISEAHGDEAPAPRPEPREVKALRLAAQ